MRRLPLSALAGASLVVLALAVPSATLMRALRGSEVLPVHLQGALVFRLVLAVTGLATVALGAWARRHPVDVSRRPEAPATRPAHWAALGALLLVALALRSVALDAGLWFDEIATYVHYTQRSFGDTLTTYDMQNQHFLFTLSAKAAMGLFGDGEGPFRLPAVLFGVASIGALFLFGRRTVGADEALLGCALLTFSYHHVWFSQNARGYTGLLFWTLLTSWLLVRGLADNRPQTWIGFALATALGFFTHLTMLFATAAQGLIWLFWWFRPAGVGAAAPRAAGRQRLNGLLFGFGLAGLLSALCYALVLPQMLGGTLEEGGGVAQWRNPLWALLELVRGLHVGAGNATVLAVGAVGFGLGAWRLARRSPITLALFALSVGVCALIVVGTGHHVWPRFFFFAAGFAVLLVVSGAMAGAEWLVRLAGLDRGLAFRLGAGVTVALTLLSAFTVPRAWAPKQDYRGAQAWVEERRAGGDAVVTVGLTVMPYRDYYGTDWRPVDSVAELDEIQRQGGTTWLLHTLPFYLAAVAPELDQRVESGFERVKGFPGTLGGGTVWVYRSRERPVAPGGDEGRGR